MKNHIDLQSPFQHEGEPRFPDGEQDLWSTYQVGLQRFDSLTDIEYSKQVNLIERERNKYIELLTNYASQIGCSFTVTPPEYVNKVSGASNDIWAHSLEHDLVQIPRFVLEKRPKGKEYVLFRKEVPVVFILVNMAHELSHFERRGANLDTYHRLFKGNSPRGERHKINFTTEIKDEEMSTDEHAFRLLKKLKIPITPEIFVAQIPRNDMMPNYRQEIVLRLAAFAYGKSEK